MPWQNYQRQGNMELYSEMPDYDPSDEVGDNEGCDKDSEDDD